MKNFILLFLFALLAACATKQTDNVVVDDSGTVKTDTPIVYAKSKIYHDDGTRSYRDWKPYKTRTISQLANYNVPEKTVQLSKYGGRLDRKEEATGFYYTKQIEGRWWIIDPDGYLFIHKAVNSINMGKSERNKTALQEKYKDETGWSNATIKLLRDNNFNGAGSWSDAERLTKAQKQQTTPLAYTINCKFMSGYGNKRGGTHKVPGHTGFPNSTIFVFDPDFEIYCQEKAKKLAENKDDKNLLGYFSDNELPFKRKTLEGYLTLSDKNDYGYIAAKKWLADKAISKDNITDEIRDEFVAYVAHKYYSIVTKAIAQNDPNHLFLGPRLYSSEKHNEVFMTVAGKYTDIICCNYYNQWTPKKQHLQEWAEWTNKPFIITEWYVKGEDSGLSNKTGAGWIVKTQKDRGLFYQNYTLALLESSNCVGWHWFRYQDNDPTLKGAELSNIDANKGIVDNYYNGYQPLLELMNEINTQVYDLIDHFEE